MTQPSPLASPLPWNLVASAYAEEVVPWFEAFAKAALDFSPGMIETLQAWIGSLPIAARVFAELVAVGTA